MLINILKIVTEFNYYIRLSIIVSKLQFFISIYIKYERNIINGNKTTTQIYKNIS